MADVCVKVAVRIRPLLPKEVLHAHRVCVRVVPGSSQVMLGQQRTFSFHHAFGPEASQDEVYKECVRPLLDTLLDGYNATVFCYGQTGSGKTYTLDGGSLVEEGGLTDRVAQDLFCLLDESSEVVEYSVTLSYLELYMEELRDLLELATANKTLHIREDERGNTAKIGSRCASCQIR
uniref:Kinesin motor domain-containing protein n=1 Tax=Periophthalmus magnuspinnatus TaxID=409849 RepID=A0A3B4ARQ9_9GOBI